MRSFPGLYFPTFGLNTEICRVHLCIHSKCKKYGPEKLHIRTLSTQYYFHQKFYFCNFREPTSNWFYQTFSNLKPFTDYKINVSCKSDKGIGPAANITLNTRQYGKLKLNLCLVPTKWSNTRQKSCNKC